MNTELGLKILASNREVGSLLGPGGRTLKALREKKFVLSVLAKVRECTNTEAAAPPTRGATPPSKKITWDEESDTITRYMHIELDLKVTVPLPLANVLFDSLYEMQRVSGVERVSCPPSQGGKDTAKLTMEKVLDITATSYQCMLFVEEVVKIMAAHRDVSGYLYGSNFSSNVMMASSRFSGGASSPRPTHRVVREDVPGAEGVVSAPFSLYPAGREDRHGGRVPPTATLMGGPHVPLPNALSAHPGPGVYQPGHPGRESGAFLPPLLPPHQFGHIMPTQAHVVMPAAAAAPSEVNFPIQQRGPPTGPLSMEARGSHPSLHNPFQGTPNPFIDFLSGTGENIFSGIDDHGPHYDEDRREDDLNELYKSINK